MNHDVQTFYNLSGDIFDVEYPEAEKLILYDEKEEISAEYNDTSVEELPIDVNSEEIGHFSGPKWQRNKISSKLKIFFNKNYLFDGNMNRWIYFQEENKAVKNRRHDGWSLE